jgi:BirA family biotin operon repressor/biotin-[acetyl-CoA-carboxylase] ligase
MRAEIFYHQIDSVLSEHDRMKQELGENNRLLIRAGLQSGGYGRDGRSWHSPLGGLYLCFDLPRTGEHPDLALFIGACAHRCLSGLFALPALKIKWPNDIYLEGKKLAGILCRSTARTYVIGLGLNTNPDRDPELRTLNATSLLDALGYPVSNRFLARWIVRECERRLGLLAEPETYIGYCNDHLYGRDANATLELGYQTIRGRIRNILPNGHLQLESEDGQFIPVSHGTLLID